MIERLWRRLFRPPSPITLDTVLMIGKRRVYTQEQVDMMLAGRRTLFRPHRGLLEEAMREVKTVTSRLDIERLTGFRVVAVEPYGLDERIGWDTYIVLTDDIPGYTRQAIGFTDGPL